MRAIKEPSFSESISSRKPFGLDTSTIILKERKLDDDIEVFAYPENGYISVSKITQHRDWINQSKVCISYAYGERGRFPYQVIGRPFIAPIGSCCTETYLLIGPYETRQEAENVISYMITKFFRFLVLQKKNTQHATKTVYEYVPVQDFSKPWTDTELYAKYGLTDEEIAFIESMIKPMDLTGGDA